MRLKNTLRSSLFAAALLLCGSLAIAQSDLSLSLTQQPANPQQYTTYTATATISNDGPETATNVAVSIPLVAGIVYVGGNEFSATAGSFTPYNNSIWTLDSLSAGSSETITLNYFLRVPDAPAIYGQVIASDQDDPDSSPSNGTPPTANEDDESTTSINGGFVPDLTLSNLSLTQNPVDSGEQIDFTFDINNIGTGSIGQNFLVQAFISVDDQLSSDDLQNGTVPTGNFNAGQTVAGVMGASFPVGLAPGNYFLILEADANSQVLESNETNNTISVPLTIEVSTPPVCSVDILNTSITCDDNGTPQAPSDDFAVIDVLVTNPVGSSFTITTSGTGAVVATGTYGTPLTFTIPLFNNQNSLLSYVVTNDAAPTNCTSSFTLVSPSICSPNGPDLQVSALQIDAAGVQSNGDLGFTFDLTNAGATAIAQTFLVQAFLSVDSTLSADDIQNGTVPTGGFGPSQTVSGVVGASNVSVLAPGDYFLILFADANRQVAETAEDNNISTAVSFTIPQPVSCKIALNNVLSVTCNDMGTSSDPSDDTASVQLQASNGTQGGLYDIFDPAGNDVGGGAYGMLAGMTISNLETNQGTTIEYTLVDAADPTCTTVFSVLTPAPCSSVGSDIDLAVTISQDPGQPAQYTIYTVTAGVTNSGSLTATGVVVDLPLPAGVVYEGGNEFTATQGLLSIYSANQGQWTVGTIPAGQSAQITINYFLRVPTSPESYVEVLAANEQDVDSTPGNGNGQVNEDDEASTLINGGFVPDLTLTNLTLAQNTIDSGTQIDFTVDINNVGMGSIAQNFLVQAYISTDDVLSNDDLQNGTIPTGTFAGGQTVVGVMGASVPVGLAPGNYFLILDADANGQVLESNENNNTISVPFTIEAVVVTTCLITANMLSIDCDDQGTLLEADDTYSVTFLVENGGATGTWTANSGGANSTLGGNYGVPFTLQGGNISSTINQGGLSLSLNVVDGANTSCATTIAWQTPAATCSASTDPCDAISEFEASTTVMSDLSVEINRDGNVQITDRTTSPPLVFTFDGPEALGIMPVSGGFNVNQVARVASGYAVTGKIRDAANTGNEQPVLFLLNAAGVVVQASIPFTTGSFNDLITFNIIDVATSGANGDILYTEAYSAGRSYQIAAFDESGNLLWEDQRIGDLVTNRIGGAVLSADESMLYFSYRDGNSVTWPRFRGVNAVDGMTTWEVLLGDLIASTAMPVSGNVSVPLAMPNGDGVLGFSATDGAQVQSYAARFDANGNTVFLTQLPMLAANSFSQYLPAFVGSRGDVVFQTGTDTLVVTGTGTIAPCDNVQGVDLELLAVSTDAQPQQYEVNNITFTLTNKGTDLATGITVDVPRPADVVYTGSNAFTANQGSFTPYGSNIWTVGDLAPGATATLVVNYFSRTALGYTQFAEVLTVNETDVDSTPGNGTGTSAVEDDEVFLDLTNTTTQSLTFFPNPLPQGEQVILDFISSGQTTQTMIFSDLTGRPIQTVQVEFQEGRNQIPVDLGFLPAGVYVVAFPQSGLAPKRIIVQE